MRKFLLTLAVLCGTVGSAWAEGYYPGARTTTLEKGKKYFISVATWYGSGCTNLLYNNSGTLAKSDKLPNVTVIDESYLFTVEEIGENYLAHIKNSDNKYIQADNLVSTETKTGVYVIPYSIGKAVCCGDDVDACDENGNKIPYANITEETPIVTIQKNEDYTNADNRNGWRYIGSLSAGNNWCTAFAFYEALDNDTYLAEQQDLLNDKVSTAEELLRTAGFTMTGGPVILQTTNENAAGYLSSNADQNTGGGGNDGVGILGLIDGKVDDPNYFHTRWSGANPNEHHYIQVDLGDENLMDEFLFTYNVRKAALAGNTSPAPTIIEVYGGNAADAVNSLITTVKSTDEVNPLLPYSALGEKWESSVIKATEAYRYLRFVVTESAGPGGNTYGGYNFFCMAEFSLSAPLQMEITNNDYKDRNQSLYALNLAVKTANLILAGTDIAKIKESTQAITNLVSGLQTSYPFVLTTDDANPALYAIKSGRDNDKKEWWYTYDENDSKIGLKQYEATQEQLWYLKEVVTADNKCALQLFPYVDNGKAMSYQNSNNGASKIVAQELNTEGWQNLWLFVSTNGNAPYGLRTYDEKNYLSNNGGVSNKMGMWNAAPSADGGTAMYFVDPAQPLADLIAHAKTFTAGTTVGSYTETAIASLQTAITTAETAYANKNYSTSELQAAINALEINLPDPTKFYIIKSAMPSTDGRSGKKIYVNNDGGMKFEDACTMAHVFQFVNAGDKTFYLKSVERGTYLSTNKAHGYGQHQALATTTENAKALAIANMGRENVVSLIPTGGAMIHAQTDNSVVVAWNNTENTSASAWIIEELDINTVSHSVTIDKFGWATLVLGYNATIPEGVTAYVASSVESNYVNLTEVSSVIPANTAVLLNAAEGTYSFNYSAENGSVGSNELFGYTITTGVTEDVNSYALTDNGENAVFGKFTGTTNKAFKAYLNIPVTSEEAAARFLVFNITDGTETGIENIEGTGNTANAAIYDLSGRRMHNAQKGIFIVNGKKVVK